MLRSKWVVRSLLGMGLVIAVAIPVYAHCGHCAADCKNMAAKMEEAKTSLGKAIEAAEAGSKGKAVMANCTLTEGKLGYVVYCIAGDKLQSVAVDAAGKAAAPKEVKELPVAHEEHEKGDKKGDKGEKAEKPDKGEKKESKKGG